MKLQRASSRTFALFGLNRTIIELKHSKDFAMHNFVQCLNRTIIELKPLKTNVLTPTDEGLNRTIIELKLEICT